MNLLWSFIKQHTKQKIIVFMSSCKQVKFVYELFCRLRPGISLLALYGTLHQMKRMSIYDKFCSSSRTVLFATDIASRGLDFPSVNWVVQMDCPESVNTYIHRVGRTARFEKGGESLIVLMPSEEESMLQLLAGQKVPIEKISVNPKKMNSIQRKAEASLARDVTLKETAQRAFKAYLKNVFLMKNKDVFKVEQLNLDQFSRSLGLVVTPRVRFLERKLAAEGKTNQTATSETKDQPQEMGYQTEKYTAPIKLDLVSEDEDGEGDDNLFQVKKVWRFDQESGSIDDNLELPPVSLPKKASKAVSKATVAKRLLKKNIKLNTKIVFNEEGGQEVFSGGVKQATSQFAKLDKTVSGIDIEVSKKIMEEEDKLDKQAYATLVKEKRQAKKLKLKAQKANAKSGPAAGLAFDDADNERNDAFIDALPDPDAIYAKDGEPSLTNGPSESEDETATERLPKSSTNKSNSANVKRKNVSLESDSDSFSDDTSEFDYSHSKKKRRVTDLKYFEDMALQLLGK